MANDDINVVIYKILRYLYECKKAGKRPRQEDIPLGIALYGSHLRFKRFLYANQ